MAELKEYKEFEGYDLKWIEEAVPKCCDIDVLMANRATQEEIRSAFESPQDKAVEEKEQLIEQCEHVENNTDPLLDTDDFLEQYVSEMCRCKVHRLCSAAQHRSFCVKLTHYRLKRGNLLAGIRFEVSHKLKEKRGPFRIWFRYDIHSLKDVRTMAVELDILAKHLSKK
jgi:hypothetical protein